MATVFVTGANRGLGLEFARQYAADGWKVLAAVREPKKAKELGDLAKKYSNVKIHQLDVADEKSIKNLAGELDDQPIDVLIHNSGVYPREGQKVGEIDYSGWRAALNECLRSHARYRGVA